MAQWVKDSVLSWQWLESLLCTGLVPGLGISICHGHGPKKREREREREKRKEKERRNY